MELWTSMQTNIRFKKSLMLILRFLTKVFAIKKAPNTYSRFNTRYWKNQ